jgi:hypothetical protein
VIAPAPGCLGTGKGKKMISSGSPPSKRKKLSLEDKIHFVETANFSDDVPVIINQRRPASGRDQGPRQPNKPPFEKSCLVCDRTYTNSIYYRQHCRDVHNLCLAPNEYQRSCSLCGALFTSVDKYLEHEERTKVNMIYCIEKMHALRASRRDSSKLYKSVTAVDLHRKHENENYSPITD